MLGLEAAVAVGLAVQEADQVELEPARGGLHARLLGRQLELRALAAQLLHQQALGALEVGGGHPALAGLLAQALERALSTECA